MSQTKAQLIDNLVQPITGALGSAAAPTFSFTADPNTGLYSPGADQVAISTNGTGRLFVNSSGSVGVGTSSPSNLFHVSGTAGTPVSFERTGSNGVFIGLKDGSVNNVFLGNTNGVFSVQTPGSSFSDKLVVTLAGLVGIGTTSPSSILSLGGNLDFKQSSNISTTTGYLNLNPSGSLILDGGSGSTVEFRINTIEAARIDSSRRLLVGTSSAPTLSSFTAGKFAVVDGGAQIALFDNTDGGVLSSFSTSKSIGLSAGANYGGGAGYAWLKLTPSATASSVIVTANSNGVTLSHNATAWAASSDERHKTNLRPISNALRKVSHLRAVTGRYKNDDDSASRSFLIAQDVLAVLPEAVDTTNGENFSLRYTEVIPLLVAAIKESKERIETLEAAVTALQQP